MTEIRTRWITPTHTPQAEEWLVEDEPEQRERGTAHIVYAALLVGVSGSVPISEYTGIPPSTVCGALRTLAQFGYIKKVIADKRLRYVPLGMNGVE